MANTLRIKRRAAGGLPGAPTPLEAGELAVNFSDNKLYIGDGTVAVPIAGKGEFVDLGSTQTITGKKKFSGGIDMDNQQLENLLDPRSGMEGLKDATNRGYVDSAIATAVSALGSVFEYVGNVSLLTDAADPFNLDTLAKKEPGDYYRVDVSGTYTAAGQTLKAKVGDAFVRTATDWQRLDNVDAEVTGTANEIAVAGDENAGYTVSLASGPGTFKTSIETKTQNIDLAGTSAGTTALNGILQTANFDGIMGGRINFSDSGAEINFGGGTADTFFKANINEVLLGAKYQAATVKVQANNLNGDSFAGPTTMDNFIIDGGVF